MTTTQTTAALAADENELVERALALVPALSGRALAADLNARLDPHSVDELVSAGLLKIHQPAAFGGYEMSHRTAPIRIAKALCQASGSVAWFQSIMATHAWLLGCFPLTAQTAVWSENPDALISTAFSTVRCDAAAVRGGFQLSGAWEFSSGCHYADWVIVRALVSTEAGPSSKAMLVPMSQADITGTWNPSGLRGSGSNNIAIHESFVPDTQTVDLLSLRGQQTPGAMAHSNPMYSTAFSAVFPYCVAVVGLGLATTAIDIFRSLAKANPVRQASVAHQLRYAGASAAVDAAENVLQHAADAIAAAETGELRLSTQERVRLKRDYSYATMIAARAVEELAPATGAHGLDHDAPFQRARRDLHAVASHFGMNWDANAEQFGRVAFDLPSTDPMNG